MQRFNAQPDKGFINGPFMGKHSAQIKCSSRQDATHLKLDGGKHRIPEDLNEEFLVAYSKDLSSTIKHCYTEVASDVFPMFVDFDVLDPALSIDDCDTDEIKAEIAAWSMCAIECVSGLLQTDDVVMADNDDAAGDVNIGKETAVSLLQLALGHRNKLSPGCSVTMTAPARSVMKHDVSGTKIGVHIIWPSLLIRKPEAQRLRNLVVVALYAQFPRRNWDIIVDIAVYRPMSSLRMLGSFKVRNCSTCSSPAVRLAKKTEAKMRPDIAKILQLGSEQSKSPYSVKAAAYKAVVDKHTRRAKLLTYLTQAKAALDCTACGGRNRIPDTEAGVYEVKAVVDSDGNLMGELTDLAMADPLIAVHLCSVRRPADAVVYELEWPEHTPTAPLAVIKRKQRGDDAADDDVNSLNDEMVELQINRSVPDQNKFNKMACVLDTHLSMERLQQYLNSGVLAEAYHSTQVAQLYRLVSKAKVDQDKMRDGTASYIMIATLRGYGSQYCLNVQRDHSSNHVYLLIDSNGRISQRCHSTNPGCDGVCGKPRQLPAFVYTVLYPHHPAVIQGLPEEIDDWKAGRCSPEITSMINVNMFTDKSKPEHFQSALSRRRVIMMKKHMALRKSSDDTVLGKRDAENELGPDHEADDIDMSQFEFEIDESIEY